MPGASKYFTSTLEVTYEHGKQTFQLTYPFQLKGSSQIATTGLLENIFRRCVSAEHKNIVSETLWQMAWYGDAFLDNVSAACTRVCMHSRQDE